MTRADAAVAAAFLLYAVVFHMGRWQAAVPFVYLSGDAGNIASYAAGLDHPELFAGDGMLGDPARLAFYRPLHVPLVRALARVAGDYGTAFISLLAPHVLLMALGFYVLGRVLFASRYWAALLAVANLMPVPLNLGEFWGVYLDPLPRVTYQALLPFVLSLAIVWRERPARWPWLMLLAGALVYVHPVSAPAWSLALWLGLWSWRPPRWSPAGRVARMLLLGALVPLAGAHFALAVLDGRASGAAPFEAVYPVLRASLPRGYFDVSFALREFVSGWSGLRALPWAWAACGLAVLIRLGGRGRERLPVLGLWAVGLAAVSVLVPACEQQLLSRARLPLAIDLIRGIRYCVPLMLLVALWPLAELHARAGRRGARAAAAAGLALTACWIAWHPPREVGSAVACWAGGRVGCPAAGWVEAREALDAIRRETPPGAPLLSTELALPIRYYALRPVVQDYRDLGILLYANHAGLPAWQRVFRERSRIAGIRDRARRLRAFLALAEETGAAYVLADATYLPAPGPAPPHALVWRNRVWALIRLGGSYGLRLPREHLQAVDARSGRRGP